MVKIVNISSVPKTEDEENYIKAREFIRGFNKNFSVLRRRITVEGNVIEKGSLVRVQIDTWTDHNGEHTRYRSSIQVEAYNGKLVSRMVVYESEKPATDEGVTQTINECAAFVYDTFGTTEEIQKLGCKLNRYNVFVPLATKIFFVVLPILLVILMVAIFGIGAMGIVNKIMLCIPCVVIGWYLAFIFDVSDYNPLLMRKWKKYDKLLTDYAKYYDAMNDKEESSRAGILTESKLIESLDNKSTTHHLKKEK